MKENIIKNKSMDLAVRLVRLYQWLCDEQKEFVMSKQLLRSGTAVGAMIREAEHAESKADFIHKMAIALKEANESLYWLELLHKTDYLDMRMFGTIYKQTEEIVKLLASIVKSAKNNL